MGSPRKSTQQAEERGSEKEGGRCLRNGIMCLLLVGVAVGAGVLIWQLIPEKSKTSIQTAVNETIGDVENAIDREPDFPSYVFDQCNDADNCCNGLDTICDLPADSIMYAGVHNAMASSDEGFRFSYNHESRLELALEAGYRGINVDIGKCNGNIKLLHGICTLGTRDPVEVFTNMDAFLTANPTEVLLVTIQIDNEADGEVTLNEIADVFDRSGKFRDRMYNHTIGQPWPTLRTLVEADERILLFHYNGESCRDNPSICPTGFHDWFATAAETRFSFASVEEVENTTSSCELTRGRRFPEFFGVNNFVTLPKKADAQRVNTKEFLQNRIQACSDFNRGFDVNVVFVDFWNQGDLPEVTQLHNMALAVQVAEEQEQAALSPSPSVTPASATTAPSTMVAATAAPSTLVPSEGAAPTVGPTVITESPSIGASPTMAPVAPTPSPSAGPTIGAYVFNQCSDLNNCCNGLDTICDLPVDSIMYAGVHNSMASRDEGFMFFPNQDSRLELALEAGYRAINIDIGKCNGVLQLVHGTCDFGNRDPVEVFTNMNNFLTANPSEVLLITIQIDNEAGDEVFMEDIADVLDQSGSFRERMYAHPSGEDWPTLRSLVQSDNRILLFHYNGESCRENPDNCPLGFHDWFWLAAAETEFSFSSIGEIQDTSLSCVLKRGRRFPNFFGVNNFVTLPNRAASEILNSKGFVEDRIQSCSDVNNGLDVNVVFVDFWDQGDLPEVTQAYNMARAQEV